MGADNFVVTWSGKTAQEAFNAAVENAAWEHGHGGYTGTIAEKHDFVMLPLPVNVKPEEAEDYAWKATGYDTYVEGEGVDPVLKRIAAAVDDKWGPAGCFKIGPETFLFFGWASS